jgi:hypothetical protein
MEQWLRWSRRRIELDPTRLTLSLDKLNFQDDLISFSSGGKSSSICVWLHWYAGWNSDTNDVLTSVMSPTGIQGYLNISG